jgi:PAS domain S-box-containing protein
MNLDGPALPEGLRMAQIERLVIDLLNDLLRASPDSLNATLDECLARLGRTCGFDRTYIFQARGDGLFTNTHEWVADDIPRMQDQLQATDMHEIGDWQTPFARGEAHYIADTASCGPDTVEAALLASLGIRSLLAVPLMDGAQLLGLIGYDMVRTARPLREKELFLLQSVARGITSVMLRAEADARARRAQAALEDTRSQLRATLDALPDLVLELDADGRYIGWHAGAQDDLVVDPAIFMGRTVEEVMPPDVASIARQAMRDVDAAGKSKEYRYRLDGPDGAERWFEATAARRAPGKPGGKATYVVVVRDITGREVAQGQLRYRESIMRGLFEMSPMGVTLTDFRTGAFVEANAAFLTQVGYPASAISSMRLADILPDHHYKMARKALGSLLAHGRYGPVEQAFRRLDGTYIPVVARGFLVESPTGDPLVWSLVQDISTERAQRVALEARTAEAVTARAQLLTAVEAMHDGFAHYDAEGRLLLCNQTFARLFAVPGLTITPGMTCNEIIGAGLVAGLFRSGAQDADDFLASLKDVSPGERREAEWELSDGRILHVLEQTTPEGGAVGLYVDVTDLRRSERHLTNVVEGAQVGTWEWDVTTGVNRINDRWADMLGRKKADFAGELIDNWTSLMHPDDLASVDLTVARVLRGEMDQFDYMMRMRHADGHWVPVQSRGRVLRRDADGKPTLMAGVHLDMSALRAAEAQLEATIDSARVGTFRMDTRDGEIAINDRWAEMLGYAQADLVPVTTQTFRSLVHPGDYTSLVAREAAGFAAHQWETEHELRMRHKDGHWVWILSRGRVRAFDVDGNPSLMMGVHVDITARKQLEFALQRERDTITQLMETSVSGIVAFDADGRIVFANREAETVLGRNLRSILGQPYEATDWHLTDLDGKPIERDDRPVARVLRTGKVLRDYRFKMSWPDGRVRIIALKAAPLRAQGFDAAVVCTVSDVTDMVEQAAALNAALQKAEAGSQAKSQFLATMSHEIRTPLNGVLGMAEVLGQTLTQPDQVAMVSTIQQSGELLLTILNDILDLAKIESGRLELEQRVFAPVQLAERAIALHGAQAQGLDLRVVGDAKAMRRGDDLRLMQVLHNLVGNAVKFTERGGVCVTVGSDDPARLRISVRDTGIGMSAEQVAHVFEDFTQADGSITRRFGGTGLGLAIVRGLVTAMGGKVEVSSVLGEGTEFLLDLPLPASVPEVVMPAEKGKAADLRGLRALVAEDNATNRLILGAMLKGLGITATMAVDGEDAVQQWRAGAFDMLLLDISMPRKDGVTALDEIRVMAGAAMPPALAVTANAMAHDIDGYHAAGFDACVSKPIRQDRLAAAIAGAMGLVGA